MSYILEALKKLESQKARVTLKRPTRIKDSQAERWFKRPRFALTLTAILALGVSVGLFLFLDTKESADSKQLVFEKPKIPKPVLQAKADINAPEITPSPREAIKDETDTKEEKIPDSAAPQSHEDTQLVFEKPKIPDSVGRQAKADINAPEMTPAPREAIKDKTDTKEEKIPDSTAPQSKKITYGYKDKIELEIPMPF